MSYEERLGHPQDFNVSYRFLSREEGGRVSGPPLQGYRCDFSYEGDDIQKTGIYMIWPEFEDERGKVLPEGARVSARGMARMWIVSEKMRVAIHRSRAQEGVKGYFMEGGRRVAEVIITKVVGLRTNATP